MHISIELSNSCNLSIIVIVADNCDINSIQSYYRDTLELSILCQKIINRSKHDGIEVWKLIV